MFPTSSRMVVGCGCLLVGWCVLAAAPPQQPTPVSRAPAPPDLSEFRTVEKAATARVTTIEIVDTISSL